MPSSALGWQAPRYWRVEQCRRYAGMAFIRRTRVTRGSLPQPTAGLLGAAFLAGA